MESKSPALAFVLRSGPQPHFHLAIPAPYVFLNFHVTPSPSGPSMGLGHGWGAFDSFLFFCFRCPWVPTLSR